MQNTINLNNAQEKLFISFSTGIQNNHLKRLTRWPPFGALQICYLSASWICKFFQSLVLNMKTIHNKNITTLTIFKVSFKLLFILNNFQWFLSKRLWFGDSVLYSTTLSIQINAFTCEFDMGWLLQSLGYLARHWVIRVSRLFKQYWTKQDLSK